MYKFNPNKIILDSKIPDTVIVHHYDRHIKQWTLYNPDTFIKGYFYRVIWKNNLTNIPAIFFVEDKFLIKEIHKITNALILISAMSIIRVTEEDVATITNAIKK